MKILTLTFLLGISLIFYESSSGQKNENLLRLTLHTSENSIYNFSELEKSKATVIVFFLTDCPASQNYTLTINKLQKKYAKENIAFDMIFPDTYSSLAEVKKFKTDYKLSISAILDPELKLTKLLNAKVAPQCFLIDANGNIVYDGRIDDWYYKPGKKRTVILSNDLDNAISKFIAGKKIEPSKTTPIGCVINY